MTGGKIDWSEAIGGKMGLETAPESPDSGPILAVLGLLDVLGGVGGLKTLSGAPTGPEKTQQKQVLTR